MNNRYPSASTYRVQYNITDRDNQALDLTLASLKYALAENDGGPPVLFEKTENDAAVEIHPDNTTGRVEITVPATDVPEGVVSEELRITLDETLVVSQRYLTFTDVITTP